MKPIYEQAGPLSLKRIEEIWHSLPGELIIASKPHDMWESALRTAFVQAILEELKKMEWSKIPPKWDGQGLPPIGAEVIIRHGRDDDDHLCVVTGFQAIGSLDGNINHHRIFVELLYKGTDIPNSRLLADIRPADSDKTKGVQAKLPSQPMVSVSAEDCAYYQGLEAALKCIALSDWSIEQLKETASHALEKSDNNELAPKGSVRSVIDDAHSKLACIVKQIHDRGMRSFDSAGLKALQSTMTTLREVSCETAKLEGRPIQVPVQAHRAYAIMRKSQGPNGKEHFHSATWHDRNQPDSDERVVEGWFLSALESHTDLAVGPRVIEIIKTPRN